MTEKNSVADYPDLASLGYDEHSAKMAEEMIAAERSMLERRKAELEDCDCRTGMFPNPPAPALDRRKMLFAAGSLAGAAFAAGIDRARAEAAKAPPGAVAHSVPADPTKVPGIDTAADGGYGSRSQFETEARTRFPTATAISSWTFSPLEKSLGTITPSGLHFERHHGGIATIDPKKHNLFIHGMVERPKKFSVADIKRLPSMTRTCFIECSGNGLTEWKVPTLKTVQGTHGLLSNTEWTGVRFSTFAREVGLKEGAQWVLAEGADSAVMTRSIPLEKLLSDGFIAYGQNGEALRPEQGYPLRLVLPGWEGNTMIKWLRRLDISDKPFMTREETSKYTDLMKDGLARQFTYTMEAKSVITFPSGEMKLPGPGFYEITGLAWTGRGKIERVEVSTDGGKTWALANLQDQILPLATTRFRYPWIWDGKPAVLMSRCTDETGYVQPTLKQLVDIRGVNGKFGSFYHLNAVFSWGVAADGSVTNVKV